MKPLIESFEGNSSSSFGFSPGAARCAPLQKAVTSGSRYIAL